MADTTLVQHISGPSDKNTILCTSRKLDFVKSTRSWLFSLVKANTDDWQVVRNKYLSVGYSSDTVEIILNSWRSGAKNTYKIYLKKWLEYSDNNKIDPLNPSMEQSLKFLTDLFKSCYSFNQIKIARSVLSALIDTQGSVSWDPNCETFYERFI